jgi:hypothetical protein
MKRDPVGINLSSSQRPVFHSAWLLAGSGIGRREKFLGVSRSFGSLGILDRPQFDEEVGFFASRPLA